jgi:hypothetical protein
MEIPKNNKEETQSPSLPKTFAAATHSRMRVLNYYYSPIVIPFVLILSCFASSLGV